MINLFKKILSTGIVTEDRKVEYISKRFRGQIAVMEQCTGCGSCIAGCPVKAIVRTGNNIAVRDEVCIFCGNCVKECPHGVLQQTIDYRLQTFHNQLSGDQCKELRTKIKKVLGRSLHIRHVDAGSCNACDFEMAALSNPIYDIQQYGIDFVASPRHADLLMVTGVITRNLLQAVKMTYEAVPEPKLVMAIGACATGGQTYGASYAHYGSIKEILPVDIFVPGCPPRPQAIIHALLAALDKL